MIKSVVFVTVLFLSLTFTSNASYGANILRDGEGKFLFRLRHEAVDQSGLPEDASASTLLSRFTWDSSPASKWSVGLEVDYLSVIGSEAFNTTENGKTRYPVVPDPEGLDLNQVFVRYDQGEAVFIFGRQRILLDDQRFVGGVGWRQNEQTYDALRAVTTIGKHKIDYSYVWNVNRIFGPDDGAQPADWHGNSHFLTAGLFDTEHHHFSGYAYLLDFENANGPANSSTTYGLSYKGTLDQLNLRASIARQADYGDSPLDYRANFYELAADYQFPGVKVSGGWQLLGSDDGAAVFSTPLATLHKFQGWSDVFLNTPTNGIEDIYVGASGGIGKAKLALNYHHYNADEGSTSYGSEWNLVGTMKLTDMLTLQAKYADYRAEDFATDRTKIWLTLIFRP